MRSKRLRLAMSALLTVVVVSVLSVLSVLLRLPDRLDGPALEFGAQAVCKCPLNSAVTEQEMGVTIVQQASAGTSACLTDNGSEQARLACLLDGAVRAPWSISLRETDKAPVLDCRGRPKLLGVGPLAWACPTESLGTFGSGGTEFVRHGSVQLAAETWIEFTFRDQSEMGTPAEDVLWGVLASCATRKP